MCIPKSHPSAVQTAPAPLPSTVPSMASASAIELGGPGGIPRGAAVLGRNLLKFGGSNASASSAAQGSASAASPQASAPASSAAGTPTVPAGIDPSLALGFAAAGGGTSAFSALGGGPFLYSRTPNAALRLSA